MKITDDCKGWIYAAIRGALIENPRLRYSPEEMAEACTRVVVTVLESLKDLPVQMSFSDQIIGTGDKETDRAIEKAYEHANPEWVQMALDVVYRASLRLPHWSVNDVRDEIEASPIKTHDNHAMGGIIGAAKKNGWIEKWEGEKVTSTVGHLSKIQVWRSKIYTP